VESKSSLKTRNRPQEQKCHPARLNSRSDSSRYQRRSGIGIYQEHGIIFDEQGESSFWFANMLGRKEHQLVVPGNRIAQMQRTMWTSILKMLAGVGSSAED
jgi:hypothetical protein